MYALTWKEVLDAQRKCTNEVLLFVKHKVLFDKVFYLVSPDSLYFPL